MMLQFIWAVAMTPETRGTVTGDTEVRFGP
jgi:hypothetical protein